MNSMDSYVDERDYKLLETDKYTFFVLKPKLNSACQNLIDVWHVLRHLQYNISDNIDKNLYDVRASEPYQGGTEPLMQVRVIEKPEL